ncbi:MAG: ribonuclease H-like domain-containing protein [Nanoarchaeota archaeon]
MANSQYYIDLYKKNKWEAICLDIEVTEFGGPISLIGMYIPKPGLIESECFIKGKNLTFNEMKPLINKAKLIVTFNGLSFDIPKINKEFPGLIPKDKKIIDLHIIAKSLNMPHSLKTLENTFGIERLTPESEKKGVAIKLWNQYKKGDIEALSKLKEYNRQDTINLYFLAEKLIKHADSISR